MHFDVFRPETILPSASFRSPTHIHAVFTLIVHIIKLMKIKYYFNETRFHILYLPFLWRRIWSTVQNRHPTTRSSTMNWWPSCRTTGTQNRIARFLTHVFLLPFSTLRATGLSPPFAFNIIYHKYKRQNVSRYYGSHLSMCFREMYPFSPITLLWWNFAQRKYH